MSGIAHTPQPPYYAVIFASRLNPGTEGYDAMAAHMLELAAEQPGYLGVESVRDDQGIGLTVSYWETLEAIREWKANAEHQRAQELGRQRWYGEYRLRICRVERDYGSHSAAHG